MFLVTLLKREWQFSWRYFLLFALIQTLGMSGWLGLSQIKNRVQVSLISQAEEMLGGSLMMKVRRPWTSEEKKQIEATLQAPAEELIETYTLIHKVSQTDLRLVEILASNQTNIQLGEVLVSQALSELMELNSGSKIKIGTKEFNVLIQNSEDSQQALRGFSLAPRLRMRMDDLLQTGLIVAEGTSATYALLWKGLTTEEVNSYQGQLKNILTDLSIKIVGAQESSEQLSKVFSTLQDYLSVASFLGFLLAILGLYYLWTTYWNKRVRDYGLMLLNGQAFGSLFLMMLTQVLIVSFVSLSLLMIILSFLLPLLVESLSQNLGWKLMKDPELWVLFKDFCIMEVFILLSLVGFWLRLKKSSLGAFLKEEVADLPASRKWGYSFFYACIIFIFLFWQLRSWKMSLSLVLGAGGVIAISYIGLSLGRFLFEKMSKRWTSFYWGLVSREFWRRSLFSTLTFLSLVLIGAMVSLVPILSRQIVKDLSFTSSRPSLFLFDIQDEQSKKLKLWMDEKKYPLDALTPMVRARLTHIKGLEVSQLNSQSDLKEDEERERFQRRGVNLTYAGELNSAEQFHSGIQKMILKPDNEIVPVSLELRYAQRLQLKLGDTLEFDVMGVPLKAQVVQLRTVKWTSFRPNFFITFPDGVINEAPKTYLATIGQIDHEKKRQIQREIVSTFPNISVLDVEEIMGRISRFILMASTLIESLLWVGLSIGLVTMISMMQESLWQRRQQYQLFLALGFHPRTNFFLFVGEWVLLSVMSFGLGTFLGTLAAHFMGQEFFQLSEGFSYGGWLSWWLGLCLVFTLFILSFSLSLLFQKMRKI